MTESYLDQLTFDKGKSLLCHPAYHVVAMMVEVLFGSLGGAQTRLQVGTAEISRASRKE